MLLNVERGEVLKKIVAIISSVLLLYFIVLPLFPVNAQKIYYIETQEELFSLERDPYGVYVLSKNIEVFGNHEPLFASKDNAFYGSIDGNGYTVSYMKISATDSAAAFIGYSFGEIKNINFVFADVSAADSAVAAGMVAYNYGKIENCCFEGRVVNGNVLQTGFGICRYNYGELLGNKENVFDENFVSSPQSSFSFTDDFADESLLGETVENVSSNVPEETPSQTESQTVQSDNETSSSVFADSSVMEEEKEDNSFALFLLIICLGILLLIVIYAVYLEYKRNKENKKPPQK